MSTEEEFDEFVCKNLVTGHPHQTILVKCRHHVREVDTLPKSTPLCLIQLLVGEKNVVPVKTHIFELSVASSLIRTLFAPNLKSQGSLQFTGWILCKRAFPCSLRMLGSNYISSRPFRVNVVVRGLQYENCLDFSTGLFMHMLLFLEERLAISQNSSLAKKSCG